MISISSLHLLWKHLRWRCVYSLVIVTLFILCSSGNLVQAQTFDSGSDGSDGALSLTTPGTIDFDPSALGLDTDGDGIYHFTTITIGAGVTVRLAPPFSTIPVFWLASGNVQIDGIIDLNGQDAQSAQDVNDNSYFPAVPGAGGFGGGVGATATLAPTAGNGPGGGSVGINFGGGGGAGHATAGQGTLSDVNGGPAYGNDFLVPLVGGSGGSGALGREGGVGGAGGAGGGALLIASSTLLTVNGSIRADGGKGDPGFRAGGGGGSGGAIHLLASTIVLSGTLRAVGGTGGFNSSVDGGFGSQGRIRVEAFQRTISGSTNPAAIFTAPFGLFLPQNPPALVRAVSITDATGTHPVASTPTGSFTIPDVTINDTAPVTVNVEARSIPLGTVVQLHLFSDTGGDQVVDSSPLAGTLALSTATATVTVPSGFSRGFVRATWTP